MRKDSYTGEIKEFHGGKNLSELNDILSDYMIRREKREILKDLPPRNPIPVRLEIENKREYQKQETQTKNSLRTLSVLDGLNAIKRLKGTSFSYKQKAAIEWIEDFLETEEPLLVFAYHKAVLAFLEKHFGSRCVKIDGTITGKRREQRLAMFKSGKVNLMFAQIDAMGEAVDGLQHVCSSCAFVEFHRLASKHDQAISRLERSGQKYVTNCYFLIAANTIDEVLMSGLDRQIKMLSKIYRGEEVDEKDLLMYVYNKWNRRN
jgi:SNF2 family DNA or RNA helicase